MMDGLKAIAPRSVKDAGRQLLRRLPRGPQPAILMYHRIGREAFDPWGLFVEEEVFRSQLDWLSSNRLVLPLSEFARRHRGGRLERDALSITIDDGYALTVKAVVPLLERFGLKATIFLPIQLVEQGREFWWDELARIIIRSRDKSLSFDGSTVNIPEVQRRDPVWVPDQPPSTARQELYHSIWSKLRSRSPVQIDAAMAGLRRQSCAPSGQAERPIGPAEIRSIGSNSLEFGSHALSHASLPELASAEKLREIRDSKARCAALTGTDISTFAYPFGHYDNESRRFVEEAGFMCAVTAESGFVNKRNSRFALPRLHVGNCDPSALRKMLEGR